MKDDSLLKICERVAKVERLRPEEMLDYYGKTVRAGDLVRIWCYGWDVPSYAVGTETRVLRVSGGGQAIVTNLQRGSGVMRVRGECLRRIKKFNAKECTCVPQRVTAHGGDCPLGRSP